MAGELLFQEASGHLPNGVNQTAPVVFSVLPKLREVKWHFRAWHFRADRRRAHLRLVQRSLLAGVRPRREEAGKMPSLLCLHQSEMRPRRTGAIKVDTEGQRSVAPPGVSENPRGKSERISTAVDEAWTTGPLVFRSKKPQVLTRGALCHENHSEFRYNRII